MNWKRIILWVLYGVSLALAVAASSWYMFSFPDVDLRQSLCVIGSVALNVLLWSVVSVYKSVRKSKSKLRGYCFVCGGPIMQMDGCAGRIGGGVRHLHCYPLEKVE